MVGRFAFAIILQTTLPFRSIAPMTMAFPLPAVLCGLRLPRCFFFPCRRQRFRPPRRFPSTDETPARAFRPEGDGKRTTRYAWKNAQPKNMRRICSDEMPFFGLEHRVENLEPSQDRNLGISEDRSRSNRKAERITLAAFLVRALPTERKFLERVDRIGFSAARALTPFGQRRSQRN